MGDAYSPTYVNLPTLTLIIDNTHEVSINVDKNQLGNDINIGTTYLNTLFTNAAPIDENGNKLDPLFEVTNNGSVLILTSKTVVSNNLTFKFFNSPLPDLSFSWTSSAVTSQPFCVSVQDVKEVLMILNLSWVLSLSSLNTNLIFRFLNETSPDSKIASSVIGLIEPFLNLDT